MPWLSQVKGVIEAWYPGQDDGDEIAAVLFGDVNPSGKLPVTFPQSLAQVPASTPAQWPGVNGTGAVLRGHPGGLPLVHDQAHHAAVPVRVRAVLHHLRVLAPGRPALAQAATGSAPTSPTPGTRTGADVAQLYVGDPASTGEPAEQLKGFQRVTLRPGQTTRVTFTVDRHAFAWWNDGNSGRSRPGPTPSWSAIPRPACR